ncbi:GNAT family N-acetyltransferase [Nocardia sp. IFM 10818]
MHTTRLATPADLTDCATVLAEAFADDPLMSAIWPDQTRRHRALPGYFKASLRHFHLPAGGVQLATDRDGHIGAVAVWDPPGHWDQPFTHTLRALPDLLPALRTRALAAISVRSELDTHHPHQPQHWYLANLGTTQRHRGQGYAAALLADRATTAPDLGQYLVCTRAENVSYYERFGFSITGTFQLPAGARPEMWAMWREPATKAPSGRARTTVRTVLAAEQRKQVQMSATGCRHIRTRAIAAPKLLPMTRCVEWANRVRSRY